MRRVRDTSVSGLGSRATTVALAAVLLFAVITSTIAIGVIWDRGSSSLLRGQVVDLAGRPVAEASVRTSQHSSTTDQDGWFEIGSGSPRAWVTVDHDAFLPRTRAVSETESALVRLTPDDGKTISLTFGGDVMFGRRFFDPNQDGDVSDALVTPASEPDDYTELIAGIRERLVQGDVTVVNLESTLSSDPLVPPANRGPRFHPTKSYVFASAPAVAEVLRELGVDVVGLGNNHMFDVLDEGLAETLDSLDSSGFIGGRGRVGAGRTQAEAWAPAVVNHEGQSIAFLACTTVADEALSYVATTEHGGAALCDEATVRSRVAMARSSHDLVVMMIHGGFPYEPEQSPRVRQVSEAARDSGAALVMNHHPHVVGGLDFDGTGLIAWSLGNLIFDQAIWPTFRSYVLTVNVRDGIIVSAYADPVLLVGYTPSGATGELAASIAEDAVSLSTGPWLVDDGTAFLDVGEQHEADRRRVRLEADGTEAGTIYFLADTDRLASTSAEPGPDEQGAESGVEVGRDILGVGRFEDEETRSGERLGSLWTFGRGARISPEAAVRGDLGVRMVRSAGDAGDTILTPLHRIPVEPGSFLTATGMIRPTNRAGATLQLSWYPSGTGGSTQQRLIPLDGPADQWERFRVDVTVPRWAVAVGLFVRLAPPRIGQAHVDLDDLALVEWRTAEAGCEGACDYLRVFADVSVELETARLAGSGSAVAVNQPALLADGALDAG